MTQLERMQYLNRALLEDMPQYRTQAEKFDHTPEEQRRLLRSLMNLRPPMPLGEEFTKVQDVFLQEEVVEKGTISLRDLTPTAANGQIYLWRGDITRLAVDGIVNAANSALLGCFVPCHGCIDNAIHSVSGLQLRNTCHAQMEQQGHEEATGQAKLTPAYNLPSKHVIHTVGPIIHGDLTQSDCQLLADCYRNCLAVALENGLQSLAFCCISTGEFHFPNDKAAEIAVNTVTEVLQSADKGIEVIFNVFKEIDEQLYRGRLGEDS